MEGRDDREEGRNEHQENMRDDKKMEGQDDEETNHGDLKPTMANQETKLNQLQICHLNLMTMSQAQQRRCSSPTWQRRSMTQLVNTDRNL